MPSEATSSSDSAQHTVVAEDGTRRYRIILGDDCPVCRTFSQISFPAERQPPLPLVGCRDPGGCRCSLPDFGIDNVTVATAMVVRAGVAVAAPPPPDVAGVALLHDPAIGVFSQEAFRAFGQLAVAMAVRRELSLSLLLVAIDRGAVAALDAPVRDLAETLGRIVRASDMVGRFSPSALTVLAQGTDAMGAQRLAERIHMAMAERTQARPAAAALTVSQGIATLPGAGTDLADLFEQAEMALADAMAEGGNRARAAQPLARARDMEPVQHLPAAAADRLSMQRSIDLAKLTHAFEGGQIEGIAIITQPGACPVCRDAARDLYAPRSLPPLPITGCSGLDGCRCSYSVPRPDPRRRPPPIPAERYPVLDLPRRLHDAALFGSDPKRNCRPELLAEYLDSFPLLPFQADVFLQMGEAAYLTRSARRSWEWVTPASAAIRGPALPLSEPFLPWVRQALKPPTLPVQATPFWDSGLFCLTNWRILFRRRDSVDSVLLADITGVELLKSGFACTIGSRDKRLVFTVDNALQVGICLTRAIRDILHPAEIE